ncbi:DNA ligase D [Bdellovibrio svalbardensis]|uniref:DNA ligase (ATP) n=1 Tax=Bdellovibrio svalbardensis TaxID=2972972 RepID=A0ABT6DIL0_9BACT|nr:DNA ligase D [Bdellovibrio svalbardensis]MDG0816697.1 DNA ligase D [Bdellovibrio svalbardensis]
MPLHEYQQKRNFKKTSEPKGTKRKSKEHALMFVIQEHHASHLHYDLRLEWEGVLKSWAIPKGPSLDPNTKRLAVEVEDHPLSYGSFEGVIPENQYGAGEVIIWDTGTWIPTTDPAVGFKKGHLQFDLKGKKLKGRWDLIRTHFAGRKNQWLLIKQKDDFVKPETSPPKKKSSKKSEKIPVSSTRTGHSKNSKLKASQFISPELAQLANIPPLGDNWIHEIKFDGYRMQAHINRGKAVLLTRTGLDWSNRFPSLIESLKSLSVDEAVLDGEVVWLDSTGRSDFQLLQNALKSQQTAPLIYYAFDLLSYSTQDTRDLELSERKKRLKMILKKAAKNIRYSEELRGSGQELLKIACQHKLEGIVSKNIESTYVSNRNPNWIKTKCTHQQEFVIGGYTKGSGARSSLGALLLGVYKKNQLHYVGKVGTGFTQKSLLEVLKTLAPLEQRKSPFQKKSPHEHRVHWLKPLWSAEIIFANWTHDGHLRAPVFNGLREDKPTKEITVEEPLSAKELESVTITNPDKILFPKEKITKLEVANYYHKISKEILPYLRNRPLSLLRCPEGVLKSCFFQKHIPTPLPATLREIPIAEKSGVKNYIGLQNPLGLTTLVQMGAFEIHCWNSVAESVENPDQIVIDFDPGPHVPWHQVVEAAFDLKKMLEQLKIKSFVKLSGGKGLHVHIPVRPVYSWEQIKAFSAALAKELEISRPDRYIFKMTKNLRAKKIFIDYFRNTRGATAVAPYSLRARPQSAVAMPLEWSQLKKTTSADEFSLTRALAYLAKRKKDPWSEFQNSHQRIKILDDSLKLGSKSFRRKIDTASTRTR